MATLNELFETYVNDNFSGVMSEAAIVKAYELLLGLTGDFPAKDERVQFWVDKELTVSDFVDEFLTTAARLSTEKAAAWGETTAGRTAVVTAAQNAAATATTLEEVGTVVATTLADTQPQTFTLTADADAIEGTSADDVVEGVTSSLSSEKTLTAADIIDGGEGSDTLAVSMKSNFTGFTGEGKMTNVENVELTNESTIDRTFDASGVTGVENYTIDATNADVVLTDLDSASKTIDYSGAKAGRIDVAFDTAFVAAAGTADEMTFKVNGLGAAAVAATTTTAAVAQVNVTSAMTGIETLNIETHGEESFLDLSGVSDAKTINVSGDQNLTLAAVANKVTVVDATTVTGNVDATLTGSGTLTQVAFGSGDDKATIDTAKILANAEVSGGEGEDELAVTGGAKTLQLSMSGVETISTGAGMTGDVILSNANTSGVNTINVGKASGTGDAADFKLTIASMGGSDIVVNSIGTQDLTTTGLDIDNSGATTINLSPLTSDVTAKTATTNDLDVVASKTADLTVNVAAYANSSSVITAASATNATLNVASGKSSAATPVEVTEFDGTLNIAKATSLTVNAQGNFGVTGAAAINAAALTSANITTTTASNVLALTAAKLESLEVTAGADLAFTGSDLSGLQVLNATTGDALNVTALAKASSVTVNGNKSTADATFAAIGSGTLDYSTAFTAIGLSGGLTVDSITTGAGANITFDVSATTGDVTVTNALTAGGTVTVEASGSTGAIGLDGGIDAETVVVNASSALGTVDDSTGAVAITAGKSVTYNGTELSANAADITTDLAGAFTATLNGGINNDTYSITSGAVGQTSVTVSGSLGLGTNAVNVDVSASTSATTVNTSGLVDADTSTIDLSSAHGNTFVGSSAVDTVTGGTGGDTITAGKGADVITLGAAGAADTVVVASGDTGITVATADSITAFTTTEDKLKLGVAGSATNYSEASNATAANFADALTAANTVMDGTIIYAIEDDGTDSFLFIDRNSDGTADEVIVLAGIADSAAGFEFGDIIA